MTKKRAERLTGYTIRELPAVRGRVRFAAFDGVEFVAEATGEIEWLALESLVHMVLNIHSRQALSNAGWVCARCKRRRQLQIHHRKYRSHGGTHRVENLEPVCWDCHRLIHAKERSL
jgi:hypothetical protein